jgi:hypothetical protein
LTHACRTVQWWKENEKGKGAGRNDKTGEFQEWFHGIINRHEAERLLSTKPIGCFLIRVAESRFGYSLSFRVSDRCKHYQVEQVFH